MRNYTTQMDAAKRGIITPEMKIVAAKEYRTEEEIRELVAKGQVAICANRLHTCIDPTGVGSMLRTKINVNLGVSRDCKDYDIEMQKVMAAVNMGAVFYLYTSVVGRSYIAVDIAMSLVFTALAQLFSCFLMRNCEKLKPFFYTSVMFLALLFSAILCFSYYPPEAFLFKDPITGGYGVMSCLQCCAW